MPKPQALEEVPLRLLDFGDDPPPGPMTAPFRGRRAENLLCECARNLRDRQACQPQRDPTPDDAWGRFYRELTPHLLGSTRSRRRGGLELEDAIQEAWLAFVGRLSLYREQIEGGGFPAWLGVVVRNRLATLEDRVARRPEAAGAREGADELIGREEDPADTHERRRVGAEVRAAIAETHECVSAIDHRILVLRWVEERSVAEIAEVLGMTASQVRDRHRRALRILRVLLSRRLGRGMSHSVTVRPGADPCEPGAGEVTP